MAADSAATLSEQKIFSSADKIFMLRRELPIGLMIFNRADFMGVPWDTIIHLYRSSTPFRSYPTLEDHVNDFLNFLVNCIPEDIQDDFFKREITRAISDIAFEIDSILGTMTAKGQPTSFEAFTITENVINHHYRLWHNEIETAPNIGSEEIELLETMYGDFILGVIKQYFEHRDLLDAWKDRLKFIAINIFVRVSKSYPHPLTTGFVFAGFGDKELFPAFYAHIVVGVVNGKVVHLRHSKSQISARIPAALGAFAQHETTDLFINGIDPHLLIELSKFQRSYFLDYPETVLNLVEQKLVETKRIQALDTKERDELTKVLRKYGEQNYADFTRSLSSYIQNNHANAILPVVAHLPKDELAAMADSLVSLASFRKKVTMEAPTVGGPTDVAVISKKDGFIWIKRKYYFEQGLNPHYFVNNRYA